MENLVRVWCNENDPAIQRENICMAGDIQPALCAPVIIGAKGDESFLRNIIQGRQPYVLSSAEFEKALAQFQKTPLTICTTVLDMARLSSGYNPSILMGNVGFQQSSNAFNEYLRRVLEAPFFKKEDDNTNMYDRGNRNWGEAIGEMGNICAHLSVASPAAMREQIVKLATAAASNSATQNRSSLFTVNAVNTENPACFYVHYFMAQIGMRFVKGSRKQADSVQSSIAIRAVKLAFHLDILPAYIRAVLEKHIKLVDDWLLENSTPKGSVAVKLCVE
ncbi:MAG: hypothetical protein FWB96_10800 [Defluviitaleaceae bacterium]|nr:hypothetical protein [Defluviitaleaceae bacterium]MCL2263366.1 hypothetical protein [Defluviitaleaceae bacterium]